MKRTSRIVVLTAAVCLPLGAVLGSYALTDDSGPPVAPGHVRIGQTAEPSTSERPSEPTTNKPTDKPTKKPTRTTEVIPAPPLPQPDDDDDDDGGDDSDDDGGDDDD